MKFKFAKKYAKNKNLNLQIRCDSGFANQLRMSLAFDYLLSMNYIKTAKQEWVVNNHNIVNYDDFFYRLPYLTFGQVNGSKIINNLSFTKIIDEFTDEKNFKSVLKKSFLGLKLKKDIKKNIDNFIEKNRIGEAIGLHVRTGDKNALVLEQKRSSLVSHKDIMNFLLKNNNQKIYLATDNAETQDKFINVFKDRIIYFEKIKSGKELVDKYESAKVQRHTSSIHVVADFFILQSCKSFFGSNESSFSIMINWIRDNIEDIELKGTL